MKELYILIITGYLNFQNEEISNIPYIEIVSSHYSFKSCDDDIVETHDYYLAKDIRKKVQSEESLGFFMIMIRIRCFF